MPLIEIVSEPDLRSPEEAYAYLTEVRKLLRYLEICDGNMEEGSMRCDANISVNLIGTDKFGERCEVKNMNSMRNVMRAIEFEAKRQIDLIENGGTVEQETRSFNAVDASTFTLRSKENAHDYRYFPEPDLPPFVVSKEKIEAIQAAMPKLSKELYKEFTQDLGLSAYDATIIAEDKYFAQYFLKIVSEGAQAKAAANWMIGPVKSYLNDQAIEIGEFPLRPAQINEIIKLIEDGKLNFASASQKLYPALLEQKETDILKLAESLNIIQNSDTGEIERIVDEVLAENPDKVEAYKNGKTGLMGMFMGQVMRKSGGKADPKIATNILSKKLS